MSSFFWTFIDSCANLWGMKTISYDGKRMNIAYIFGNEVIVDLPKSMIFGHMSRMPIKISELSKRQQAQIRKLQSTV